MSSGYLRCPDVHGDLVVFCADDDLWLAPLEGGRASRITTDHVPVRDPRFSPSGTRIAWTSTAAMRPEAFMLDLSTGRTRRLTWLGSAKTRVVGWADEDHVVVSSPYQRNDTALSWLYRVGMDGGIEDLGHGPGMDLTISDEGAVAIVTPNSGDCSRWKRYRGGTAAQIWLRPAGGDAFTRLLHDDHDGRYAAAGRYSVGWVGERLIFSSDMGAVILPGRPAEDPGEQAQLWSVDGRGGDLQCHTHHDLSRGYVRDPRTDGTRIVYHARGRLYAMDGLAAEPVEIPVELGVDAPAPVWVEPTDRLERVVADHGGDGSLVEWRGAAYFLTHRSGPARALSAEQGVRIREPRVLGATGQGVWASDAVGSDCLEVASLDGSGAVRRIASGQVGRVLWLDPDPKGGRVAAVTHDGRILVVDIDTGAVRVVGRSAYGEATGLAWSPDGRYLAWRSPMPTDPEMRGQIVAADLTAEGAGPVPLTKGAYDDSDPVFTSDGRYLVMLSARTFDPSYDGQTFDLSFGHTIRPWLVPLSADEPSPFGPSPEGWRISEVQEARGKDGSAEPESAADQGKVTCRIDVDGFEERMVPFPVASGDYRGLAAVKDGLVWIETADRGGELGAARAGVSDEAPSDTLWHFGLASRKAEQIVDAVDSFSVSGDGERLVARHKDEIVVVPSDHKTEAEDPARIVVDLSRLRRRIDPRAEWRQMFEENGRLMASHYWREDMNGTDWQAVLASYRPTLDRLLSVDDLDDVLWETVAELNTSHSYVMPAAADGDPSRRAGRLGADLGASTDRGATVLRVVPGESSDPRAWSPLRAAGVAVRDGDAIVAVDGQQVSRDLSVEELLEGSAGRTVELTVRPAGTEAESDTGLRRVAVVPMADESVLRYHDWVASRRQYVEEHSGGRIGYLHVPDMVADGWAELHRQISEATGHEAVIADVRFNHGGHTSELVIERLARRVVGWDFGRWSAEPSTYPQNAVRGPIVLVTNQWAGSDGDIVSAATQALGFAPVVGERSWGGVIGIDGRFDLVDGTGVTQPRYAGWYGGYGWGVENHGVDPDIEVTVTPEDWTSDRDVQLDAAIAECLRRLGEHPAAVPPQLPPPAFGRAVAE